MIIETLPLLIAFGATLVGIVGNTWDKRRKGLRKLTTTGWLVVAFAALSLFVSGYQARQGVLAKQEQAKKATLLRTLARDETLAAIWGILDPFERLADLKKNQADDGDPVAQALDDRLYTPIAHLDEVGTDTFLDYLDGVKALDCPSDLADRPGCTWAGMFSIAAWRGDEKLRDITTRYADVLDPEILELIQTIRSHKMLDILKVAEKNVETNRQMGHTDLDEMSIGWLLRGPHEASVHYIPFFTVLRELSEKLGIEAEQPDQFFLEKGKVPAAAQQRAAADRQGPHSDQPR